MREQSLLRVAAYTGGVTVPSARFRLRQYMASLAEDGIAVTEFAARCGQYPPTTAWQRPLWALGNLAECSWHALRSRRYNLVFFQRERLSTFYTTERFYGRPRILDVDDAIWVHRRGAFALRLGRACDAIICGNSYITQYFEKSGAPVFCLPTAVDTARFRPCVDRRTRRRQVIGWSGTSSNLQLLEALDRELAAVLDRFDDASLRVISDRPPKLDYVPASRVEFVRWSPETEVKALRDLRIGLMPLADNEWSRGKCAFKMLTYMACGVPVVASPIGMNAEILADAEVGFGARTADEWVDGISMLLRDSSMANRLGRNARKHVESTYSLDILAPRFGAILKEVASCW